MTISSPIFRKLLLSAFLVIVVMLVVLDLHLTRLTSRREAASVEQQLAAQARILSAEMAGVPLSELETWAMQAGERAQSRITVINPAGAVIADSQHDPETMENHAGRPEVREAMQGRAGVAMRHSATLNRELVYFAAPVTYQEQAGMVLRLAVPLRELDRAIADVRWSILRVSLLAALLGLALTFFFSRSFTRRIRRVQSFAESLVNARFSETLPPGADDELGTLARSLNGMSVQLRDMLDRLRLESARLEAILSSMVEGVLAVDNELRVTFCNGSFARAVGARLPVPERLPLLELVRDPAFLNMLSRVLVSGESLKQRLELTAAQGRSFEIQAAPLELHSRRGAIAILHDITDLERLERVRRDFVANVSHELRTPLAAIQGYAETLLNGALEDKDNNRRFLEVIKAHAVRLSNIASDLLVLSELESGQPDPPSEQISVRETIESARRSIESQAKLRDVSIACVGVSDEYVRGHRIRLEQALVNMLDNAVKFNRPGGEVRVEFGRTAEGKVWITVSDDGIGIPSDDLSRIFERFYRVDKARSREAGGTGLGLSIVKHVVERMKGSVTVKSQLGKGSKFTLLFPST